MTKQKRAGRTQLVPQSARFVETQIKSNNLEEFLSIFAPLTSVLTVIFLCHGGANPKELMKMLEDAGQKGKNQLGGLIPDSPLKQSTLKLQKQNNGRAPDASAMEALGKMIPAAAQKELIQKYLEGIRPAVASQINLPENALRKPIVANSGSNQQRAKSISPAPLRGNRTPHSARSALSMVSAPATKPRLVAKPSSSVPAAAISTVSDQTARTLSTAPSSIATGQRPCLISRPITKQDATKTITPPVRKVDKTTFDHFPSKNVGSMPGPRNQGNTSSSKGVTIDPKVLAKMKKNNEKRKEIKKVTIDPKALAKMKTSNEKKS